MLFVLKILLRLIAVGSENALDSSVNEAPFTGAENKCYYVFGFMYLQNVFM